MTQKEMCIVQKSTGMSYILDLVKANDRLYESNNHYSVDLKRFVVDLQTVNSSLVPPDKVMNLYIESCNEVLSMLHV